MRPFFTRVLAVALALSVVGCGGDKKVSLSGSVKVKGQPLASGSIMVQSADGTTASGTVENGTYTVDGVSPGTVKIAVIAAAGTAGANRSGAADRGAPNVPVPPAAPKPIAKIPPEYQKLETTPLTHDTAAGKVKDIDLP